MAKKKNKKSFSTNLDSLFGQRLFEDNAQDNPAMFDPEEEEKKEVKKEKTTKTKTTTSNKKSIKKTAKKKAPVRKSFSNNLEQFFKESLDGIMEGVITDVKRKDLEKKGKRAVGLDLLIQRTTDASFDEKRDSVKPMTKRVTVVLDSSKIDTLKEIAKSQKMPLRKLMAELVEDFLGKDS